MTGKDCCNFVIANVDVGCAVCQESDRIEQKDAVKESHNVGGYRFNVVTSDLVIHGVHVSDQGVYRCTVTTHDNKQSHRSQTFYVVGTPHFVHLSGVF